MKKLQRLKKDFLNWKSLEVLVLSDSEITTSLGQLGELESLKLKSLRQLGQLEFLKLSVCSDFKNFPESIGNLFPLRFLNLEDCE